MAKLHVNRPCLLIPLPFTLCPLSISLAYHHNCWRANLLARHYTNSTKDNFDIYLPAWLAKYTKLIYTTIFAIVTIVTLYQMLN
jgi:hypothetical protein